MRSTNFLIQIIERRRAAVAERRAASDVEAMRREAGEARARRTPRRLRDALQDSGGVNIIAEIKRASPSKGMIGEGVEPAELARKFAAGGAIAVSVLTEEEYFRGSLDDLEEARAAVELPVLRKDFIVDKFQIYEAAIAGADALLLIVAALGDEHLARLRAVAEDELGLDALVEVHTEDEMRRARDAGATLIGVNNRDLHTFDVSLQTSIQLARFASGETTLVSESGLRRGEELRDLRELGFKGFLMGETLMRASDPQVALQQLLNEAGVKSAVQLQQ